MCFSGVADQESCEEEGREFRRLSLEEGEEVSAQLPLQCCPPRFVRRSRVEFSVLLAYGEWQKSSKEISCQSLKLNGYPIPA